MENLVLDNNKFEWQKPLREALVEPNPDKFEGKGSGSRSCHIP